MLTFFRSNISALLLMQLYQAFYPLKQYLMIVHIKTHNLPVFML